MSPAKCPLEIDLLGCPGEELEIGTWPGQMRIRPQVRLAIAGLPEGGALLVDPAHGLVNADRSPRSHPYRRTLGRLVAVEHVDRVDEAHLLGLVAHHQRVRARAAAEEAHAAAAGRPRSRRWPRRRCSRPAPGRSWCRRAPRRVDAHRVGARALLVAAPAQPRLDLTAQAAQRGRGEHALRRAADAHHRVHAGAADGARDGRRQVAVAR